jgi:hypothetical protein
VGSPAVTITNNVITGMSAGIYVIRVTDANLCSTTIEISVSEPAATLAIVSSLTEDPTCFGGNDGSVALTISGGTTPLLFQWSNGANVQSAMGLTAGTYTLTITDANGCQLISPAYTLNNPTAVTLTIGTIVNTACNASVGSVTLTANANGNITVGATTLAATAGEPVTFTGLLAGFYTAVFEDADGCQATASFNIINTNSNLTASVAITEASCAGAMATATINVVGGTAPFTYSLNGGTPQASNVFGDLTAGSYNVIVSDDMGCTFNVAFDIDIPAPLLISIVAQSNVSCFEGDNASVTLVSTGGVSPYIYSILTEPVGSNAMVNGNMINTMIAGDYTIRVTDVNDCTADVNVTITQPALALSSTISGTDVSCLDGSDGTASISPVGGTAPYSIIWSTGSTDFTVTGLSAGISYSVSITDVNGCMSSNNITLNQPVSAVTVSIVSVQPDCDGGALGSATATASGGTGPYNYLWSNGVGIATITNLTAGTYTVFATDANGCIAMAAVVLNDPAGITAQISGFGNVTCHGSSDGSATVTASGGSNYSYLWSDGQTLATATGLGAGIYTVTVTDVDNSCTAIASVQIGEPAELGLEVLSIVDAGCNGGSTGSATVVASGGTAPYSYEWSTIPSQTGPTASGLAAGDYTVTVTDANMCTEEVTVTIGEASAVTAAASTVTDVLCFGQHTGVITVMPGGGTAPYTYLWSHGSTDQTLTGVGAGTYSVTVFDSKGCTAVSSTEVTEPASALTASINAFVNPDCQSNLTGSATVSATGGTEGLGYSYLWSDGQTTATAINLQAGLHMVTVTDAQGCTASSSVVLTDPNGLTATITGSTNNECFGDELGIATVTATGGTAPYEYEWSTTPVQTGSTATGLAAGQYTATVRDANGCEAVGLVNITQPTELIAEIISSSEVSCFGAADGSATVNASGGTTPYSYVWPVTAGSQTTGSATGLEPGTYVVTVTDANMCTSTAEVEISGPAGGLDITTVPAVLVNPTCHGGNNGGIDITVSGGTIPYTYAWSSGDNVEDPTGLGAGEYFVTITDANSCTIVGGPYELTEPTAVVASITIDQQPDCEGNADGIATVTAGGGIGAYSYLWSNGETTATAVGLTAGTHFVTVTDSNGCTAVASVLLNDPTGVVATITATADVSCNGGMDGIATVTVSGGVGPYSYAWSHDAGLDSAIAENLAAGQYTATVTDANGCEAIAIATIGEPTLLTAQILSTTDVSCTGEDDGIVTVLGNGGVTPYSYTWSHDGSLTSATATDLSAGTYTITITDANGCTAVTSVTLTAPAALTISASQAMAVSCVGGSDGEALVGAGAGTAPYSYLWSNGSTDIRNRNLSAGTYGVTVTDANGCTAETAVEITEPAAPLAVVVDEFSHPDCAGGIPGIITVSASNGTGAYSYSWSHNVSLNNATASGLPAGTYTVTVMDANGCVAQVSQVLNDPAGITAQITAFTNVTCHGAGDGTATVTASGGASYSYLWSDGQTLATATGLGAGIYTVTVTDVDNSCTAIASVQIGEPAELGLEVFSIVDAGCNGGSTGSATVVASGGTAPYSYEWSTIPSQTGPTASGLAAGDYTVTVTDANMCTEEVTVTIGEASAVTAAASTVTDVLCFGQHTGVITVMPGGGTAPYTYLWSHGSTDQTLTGVGAGTYSVTVFDSKGCTAVSSTEVTEPASALTASINAFVNPDCQSNLTGSATVSATGGTEGLGYSYLWSDGQTTATAINLQAGLHMVTVTDAQGCTASSSVVLTDPNGLTATITGSTNNECFGDELGIATVTATGGTAPYEYEWSTTPVQTGSTATGLAAGQYTATVRDANGCEAVGLVNITQPTELIAEIISSSEVSCFGAADGSATVNASGGTTPYSYAWPVTAGSQTTGSATGLEPGTYVVTVTDANMCTSTAEVEISGPAAGLDITTVPAVLVNPTCHGANNGSIDITVSGGTIPYTYAWSSGDNVEDPTGLGAGEYFVTITDANSCTIVGGPYELTEPTAVVASITIDQQPDCEGNADGIATVTARRRYA